MSRQIKQCARPTCAYRHYWVEGDPETGPMFHCLGRGAERPSYHPHFATEEEASHGS